MLYKILGFISIFVGIMFVGALLFLSVFNNYNIHFVDYLEANHQLLTNGFILIGIGVFLTEIENNKHTGE